MSIQEEVSFDKDGNIVRFPIFRKLFLALTIILVAGLSFGIGRLSTTGESTPIKIEFDQSLSNNIAPNIEQTASVINAITPTPSGPTAVIASKNSNKYHFSHCPGAKQIKEENKITFNTPQEAESAGYVLASNCKAK